MRTEVMREVPHHEKTLVDKIKKKRMTWIDHVTRMDEIRLRARAMHCHIEGTRIDGQQDG